MRDHPLVHTNPTYPKNRNVTSVDTGSYLTLTLAIVAETLEGNKAAHRRGKVELLLGLEDAVVHGLVQGVCRRLEFAFSSSASVDTLEEHQHLVKDIEASPCMATRAPG
jgi:hypothetical protein